MNQKQLTAEIIPAEKLPGDLRYELSLSPDHIVRLDGYTYLSMGEKTAVFPDNPDTDALLSSLINGSKVLDRPASASGLFQRMLTDAQFTPDAELYKACRVKDKQKRSVVVFRGSGTSGKDLYRSSSPEDRRGKADGRCDNPGHFPERWNNISVPYIYGEHCIRKTARFDAVCRFFCCFLLFACIVPQNKVD